MPSRPSRPPAARPAARRCACCWRSCWATGAFVDEAVGPAAPIGTRKLYEDKDLGFVVLAHCNPKPHKSPPHDHGSSWAVYGQAVKHTDMSEYRRLDGGNGAGEARLEQVKSYRSGAGPCRHL